jgi:RHS repeat-associated protein
MTDYGNNLHFTWDKGNQLASVVFDLYNLTVSYKYDQNGMRAQKLVNGFAYMDFTYIGDKLISQKDYIGNTTLGFIYDAMGEMIGVKYDGETYFYMRNLQGDVCGIYDSDGDLIVKYTYDVWGKRLNVTDANGVYISDLTSIAHVNPIRYRGYYYDSEFEFYYLQSRYYWPAIGRFISADSLFMAGDALVGTNMYAYCSNNPVMYSDPSGHSNEFSLGFAKTFRTLGMIARLFLSGKSLLNIYSYDDLVIRYNASFNDIEWPTGNEQVVDDYPNYPSGGEHHGTDFGGNEGDPIYAAVGGQVITVVNKYAGSMRGSTGDPSFGNYVLIKDANGTLYYYAHMELDSIVVQEGEYVIAGQRIGGMGITGNAYCIHLHYAVRVNGDWVNPADYLPS